MNLLYIEIKKNLITILWIFIILLGVISLSLYSTKATHSPVIGNLKWPAQSKLNIVEGKAQLLMFLHPHCPCSRASVNELEKTLPHINKQFNISAIFIKPNSRDLNWVKSELYQKVANIPGVNVAIDENYFETNLFQATTSGQVLLYNQNLSKVFSGAITPGRGHEGDSRGKDILIEFANGKLFDSPQILNSYGCSLKDLDNQANLNDS